MIVLRSSMQEEDAIKHTNGRCMCLCFSMQKEDILKLTNAMCTL